MNGKHEFDFESGFDRILRDVDGSQRLLRVMAEGDLRRLPGLFAAYGWHPIPGDICITLVQVLKASIFVGVHSVDRWIRFATPAPHDPREVGILLTEDDIKLLKGTDLPPGTYRAYVTTWDYLVARGYIENRPELVSDYVVINERRELEICKSMHSDPVG